jgi:hypothetical protein
MKSAVEPSPSTILSELKLTPDCEQTHQIPLENQPQPATSFSEGMPAPDFERLVVLVPDRDVDETEFVRKLWAILGRRRAQVLLISMVTNRRYGPEAQRRLVTLAAVAQDACYQIETRVIFGQSWTRELDDIARPGDLIVCHAAQQAKPTLRGEAPLADLLQAELETPVYVLTGLYSQAVAPRPPQVLRQGIYWGILCGVLAGFFVIEAGINHLTSRSLTSALLVFIFAVEVGLVSLWNYFLA